MMNKVVYIIILFIILTGCGVHYADKLAKKGFEKECEDNAKAAMKIYNRAIFFNKRSAEAYWRRGDLYNTYAFKYNYRKAITDLTISIKLDSTFNAGDAFNERGLCKRYLDDTIGALSDYNKAIAIRPNGESFYYDRAILKYYRFRDSIGAMKDVDSAIKYWKGFDLGRQLRAELRIKIKDYKGAKEDYDSLQYGLRETDSSYAHVFYYRGIANFETGNTIEACKDWTISSKLGYSLANKKQELYCK